MSTLLRIPAWILTIATTLALLMCAFGGDIDAKAFPLGSVCALALPVVVPVALVVLVMDLLWWRRPALVLALALLISSGRVLDIFPLNGTPEPITDKDRQRGVFTLLTYNVNLLLDHNEEYPDNSNPSVQYILDTDADIVCLQELNYFVAPGHLHTTKEQYDRLMARYPYVLRSFRDVCLFSKYPVEEILLPSQPPGLGLGDYQACRVDIHGRQLVLFNVHLRSYDLTQEDKDLYVDLTRMKGKQRIAQARRSLLTKLLDTARDRAAQTDSLAAFIDSIGASNTIVCGDFNDVPGSYPVRTLESKCHLKQVYPQVGRGYMRTFNSNRLYFRIDHVLYRGALTPRSMERGNLTTSDHFPLLTTFVFQ